MSNANTFLSLYNKTDHFLKEQLNIDRNRSFSRMLDEASESSTLVRRYRQTLKQFGQLRNAIVHEYRDGEIIAEPTENAVEEFQQIYQKLTRPERVLSVVGTSVVCLKKDESIEQAINLMNKHDYSQIPVIDDSGFIGMFTSGMLLKTLGEHQRDVSTDFMLFRMDEVLKYNDRFRQVKFLARTATVYDVLEIFEETALKDHQIDAILITESGDSHQMPIGIITDSDLPELLKYI